MLRLSTRFQALRRQFSSFRLLLAGTTLLYLLGGTLAASTASAQEFSRDELKRALQSTVLLLVPDNNGDLLGSGSGTIMDAEAGYILTNFHVMGDKEKAKLYNKQGIAIVGIMPTDLKGAPVLKYVAQVINGDPENDLAVLQIVGLLDDAKAALPTNLGLTAINRGNSDDLLIGDSIAVFGYPSLGGDTVSFSDGKVSGFLDDDQDAVYEWLKTNSEINPGNSGGLAINADGSFIGIPTAVVSDQEVSGKIGLIRTGNIALDFYDATVLGGARPPSDGGSGSNSRPGSTSALVSDVVFGTAVNRDNEINKPSGSFASGITDLYASFAYENFEDGADFSVVWHLDGEEILDDSWQWDAGSRGRLWVNINNERGLDDGFYEAEFSYEGDIVGRAGATVGESRRSGSGTFGEIVFSSDLDDDNRPVNEGNTFTNVDVVFGSFPVNGMENGTPWASRWLLDGEEVLAEELVWDSDDVDSYWLNISHPDGLPEGRFDLELYIDGELAQSGSFTIVKQGGTRVKSVNVVGNVHDADNKRKSISGAMVVFLNPGVSVDDWVDNEFAEDDILATGSSGRNGDFQLDGKVTPGEAYSVVVIHDDYQAISVDDYEIPANTGDPYELDVAMERN